MLNQRRSRPTLELLEDRWTPAGSVTGSLANGTWTLIGDAAANDIRINPTAILNQFEVTGLNGTAVAGVTSANNVKNIVVKLGAGDDHVDVNNTGTLAQLLGNLTIIGGKGANHVEIDDLKMKSVTVTNGRNIGGTDNFYLTDSIIQKNVTVANGAGAGDTVIHRSGSGVSSIGGNLTIINGVGVDSTYISDTNIGGNITVKNGLPNPNGEAGYFSIYNTFNETRRSIVGGNVLVSYQGGTVASDGLADTEVRGNVRFSYGSGDGEVLFYNNKVAQPVHIHGSLTVIGQGDNVVSIGESDYQPGVIVDRNFTVLTGAGSDEIYIHRLTVGGATRISTGASFDAIAIDESTFTGPTTILTAGGSDRVHVETNMTTALGTQFTRPLLINLGAGDDRLEFGSRNDSSRRVELLARADLQGGAGNDELKRFNLVPVFGARINALFEAIKI